MHIGIKFHAVLFTLANFLHSKVFNASIAEYRIKRISLLICLYNFIFPYGWKEYHERFLTYLVSTFVRLYEKQKWIVK